MKLREQLYNAVLEDKFEELIRCWGFKEDSKELDGLNELLYMTYLLGGKDSERKICKRFTDNKESFNDYMNELVEIVGV